MRSPNYCGMIRIRSPDTGAKTPWHLTRRRHGRSRHAATPTYSKAVI